MEKKTPWHTRFTTWLLTLSVKGIESSMIDLIAAVTPWLAPLIPAYLVYHNMAERLNYSQLFALIGAAAVEFLGLSAVHTAVTFWKWNDNRKTGRAPTMAAIGAGAFYVVIVLTVNAALDIWRNEEWVKIAAHALLSLLSVDAGLIIAMRSSHARMVRDDEKERKQRREERNASRNDGRKSQPKITAKAQETPAMLRRNPATAKAQFLSDMAGRNGAGPLTTAQIMAQYNVSERTAQYWLTAYREQHDATVRQAVN